MYVIGTTLDRETTCQNQFSSNNESENYTYDCLEFMKF